MSVASLPMYDFPWLRHHTDALWASIRDALRAAGFDAPDVLERDRPVGDVWRDPAMILSQTCGRPYALGLHRNVQLVGTPDFGVEGCPAGYYNSAIVVRADEDARGLGDFIWWPIACNAEESQSGFAAMFSVIEDESYDQLETEIIFTGAHIESMRAVALGRANVAAIDAVTWRHVRDNIPEADALRVLRTSPPTPALPLVTAAGNDAVAISFAVAQGIAMLPEHHRRALDLKGLVTIGHPEYMALAD